MSERKRQSVKRRQLDILNGKGNVYVGNEWTDWLISKKGIVEIRAMRMPIMEHKKTFLNRRPDWAKTFTERDISKDDIYKEQNKYFVYALEKGRQWRLERELFPIGGQTMVAERINDTAGVCKQVAVIYPEGNGTYKYREETWIARGKWIVSRQYTFDAMDGFYTDGSFLKLTKPMGELFIKRSGKVLLSGY